MKWFPKNTKISYTTGIRRPKLTARRFKNKNMEIGITWRDEFDKMLKESYTDMSVIDADKLWHKIGSIILSNNFSGTAQDRLKLAFKQISPK